ncbi:MAG: hypothetical protein U0271_39845 [Polyangiaceae bacterium]
MAAKTLLGARDQFALELQFYEPAGALVMAEVALWLGGHALGRPDDPVMLGLVLDSLEGLVRTAARAQSIELFHLAAAEAWPRLRAGEGISVPTTEFFDDYELYCVAADNAVRFFWCVRETDERGEVVLDRALVTPVLRAARALHSLRRREPGAWLLGDKGTFGVELDLVSPSTVRPVAVWLRGHSLSVDSREPLVGLSRALATSIGDPWPAAEPALMVAPTREIWERTDAARTLLGRRLSVVLVAGDVRVVFQTEDGALHSVVTSREPCLEVLGQLAAVEEALGPGARPS